MSYNSKYTGAEVDAALDLANSALQEHQDLTGYQVVISDLDTIREGAAKGATALQSVPSEYVTETELTDKGYATTSAMDVALGDKVDKVDGKQLSTEDFTTALKSKLEGLSNYDDTTINAAVEKLRTDFDTLVSGDTTTAIENFNEIVAFLDGIEDSESLDSIIASIERQIAGKQDAISDLETIREGAAKGATAIQEIPSEYVTETELEQKGYATAVQLSEGLETKQDIISDLTTIREGAALGKTAVQNDDLEAMGYATEDELEQGLSAKQDKVLKFENLKASSWVSDSAYEDYPYRCDLPCAGVTASDYAEVVFALEQAVSGSYAPLCETKAGIVSIWSAENTTITVPTIIVTV